MVHMYWCYFIVMSSRFFGSSLVFFVFGSVNNSCGFDFGVTRTFRRVTCTSRDGPPLGPIRYSVRVWFMLSFLPSWDLSVKYLTECFVYIWWVIAFTDTSGQYAERFTLRVDLVLVRVR
jgi:hypothetical protein